MACSFLIVSTVGEFIATCITVSIKYPYDVGAWIKVNDSETDVAKIYLLHSIFWESPNTARSKELKEQLTVNVSVDTSLTDLETLRALLAAFVAENQRDCSRRLICDSSQSMGRVPAQKQFSIRTRPDPNTTANSSAPYCLQSGKFLLVALVSSGLMGALNYTVPVIDEAAEAAKAKFDEDQDAKRMVLSTSIPE
ncbi:uncharacterized protein Z518_05082 [Rhinocladiella mackenziei CBS 650.93]|uniref:Uncharacterized protein n=1 Tax=Rhinocladiella mackenziei CBS 650.93 TaxID=1442369 RepID=A0A0D2JD68_9EURO|nr:uncharacterized protein Z518_05082 [Rhinocladiella mackenziei CBS 650.93]KIX07105.1 hypothetical protein Z518_05082 [Rhinocladiella mackenziei CBS 650.93]